MIRLGEIQNLIVSRKVNFGVYLKSDLINNKDDNLEVLLPQKYVPNNLNTGDSIRVFVYKDSEDRLVATTKTPYITMGHITKLEVVSVDKIGAFLNWGLEKDLFLPFKEQTVLVNRGDSYLVKLYIDKSKRLCASMDLYSSLSTDHIYRVGDKVQGTIYDKNESIGYFVAIDNKYSALIPSREAYGNLYIGKEISARIIEIRDDNKITLAVRDKIPNQMDKDCEVILELLKTNGSRLGFGEKDSPETIKMKTGLSKASFKRAIGRLLKQDKIIIEPNDIVLKKG